MSRGIELGEPRLDIIGRSVLVVALVAGVVGVVVFVVQASLAQAVTMAVNYLEHWGLKRRAGSKATAASSVSSPCSASDATRIIMFA